MAHLCKMWFNISLKNPHAHFQKRREREILVGEAKLLNKEVESVQRGGKLGVKCFRAGGSYG